MHAAVVDDYDHDPRYGEFRDPEPGQGDVLAEVVASGVHQLVRSVASGAHYTSGSMLPFVPGTDGVVRLPDGRLAYGGGVAAPWGMFAERAAVPAERLVPVPDGLAPEYVAALVNPATSCWIPLRDEIEAGSAPTVLVLGATGASGSVAVQVARHFGAGLVLAAGRNPARLQRALELGADAALELRDGFPDALHDVAPDGVDLVLDYLWGPVATATLHVLAAAGREAWRPVRWVQIGSLAGQTVPLDAAHLRSRNLRLRGTGIGSVSPKATTEAVHEILALASGGGLSIDFTAHPLAEVEAVWNRPERLVLLP